MNQGVRQGGVTSAYFLALEVDDVLCKLNHSGHGCYIAWMLISAIMYADDIMLVAPSVKSLHKLITLCQAYIDDILSARKRQAFNWMLSIL